MGEMCGCRKSTPIPSWVIGNTKGGEVQKPKLLKESKTKIEFLQGLYRERANQIKHCGRDMDILWSRA